MILAIDPGPVESAYMVIDPTDCRPTSGGKIDNDRMLQILTCQEAERTFTQAAIEMVASYGMPVGAEIFDTCVWIGRFQQALIPCPVDLIYRRHIRLHHCGSPNAGDANITQALRDRFAKGQPNYGKGTKAEPGWFHGFAKDMWQAYALAVYTADHLTDPVYGRTTA